MPVFATHNALYAAVASWLDRTDLTSVIPQFVGLAEAQLSRRLRTRDQWTEVSLTIDSEYEDLPSDWAETSTLTLQTSPVTPLRYVTPARFREEKRDRAANGTPQIYTIVGRRFRFAPTPDSSRTAVHEYWALLEGLSDSNTSNWLLEQHPDLYLHATLAQACEYLRDPEGKANAEAAGERILAEIERADKRADTPTTPTLTLRRPIG